MSHTARTLIVYPTIASTFGGAVSVTYSARFAWVRLPGRAEVVRLCRSGLSANPVNWTSFTLADACHSGRARAMRAYTPRARTVGGVLSAFA